MKQPILRFFLDGRPNKKGERQILLDISIGYSELDFTLKINNFNSDRKKYKPINISTMFSTMAKWITPQYKPAVDKVTRHNPQNYFQDFVTLKGIDIKFGLEITQGNKELYKKVLHKFGRSQFDFVEHFSNDICPN